MAVHSPHLPTEEKPDKAMLMSINTAKTTAAFMSFLQTPKF